MNNTSQFYKRLNDIQTEIGRHELTISQLFIAMRDLIDEAESRAIVAESKLAEINIAEPVGYLDHSDDDVTGGEYFAVFYPDKNFNINDKLFLHPPIPSQQLQSVAIPDDQEWINSGCPVINREVVSTDGNYFIFGEPKDKKGRK